MKRILRANLDLLTCLLLMVVFALLDIYDLVQPVRLVIGILVVLFIPGYSLWTAMAGRNKPGFWETAGISIGLSLPFILVAGVLLNVSIGIHSYSILAVVFLVFAISATLIVRRRRKAAQPDAPRPVVRFHGLDFRHGDLYFAGIVLLLAIIAVTFFVLDITRQNDQERYTALYFQDPSFLTGEFPLTLERNAPITFTVGIENHEFSEMSYRLDVRIDSTVLFTDSFVLLPGEVTQRPVNLVPGESGADQKVMILLYKGAENAIYRSLHFWIQVQE